MAAEQIRFLQPQQPPAPRVLYNINLNGVNLMLSFGIVDFGAYRYGLLSKLCGPNSCYDGLLLKSRISLCYFLAIISREILSCLKFNDPPTRKRWGGCWGGLSCFRKQNGGKRIVPASRIPEANALSNQPNGPQAGGLPSQTTGIALSLLAPPSSPASFSNSALPSTAQSPSCFLSANSPGGPSSTMFVTGPYAHETQLGTDKTSYIAGNDLQATYSLYPGSPASTLRSPVSRTSGDCLASSLIEREFPPQWESSIPSQEHATKSDSGRFLGLPAAGASKSRQDSNFFCPETFAQFYLDQSSFSNSGGRLSISRESDAYSNNGNVHQNRQNKTCKPDAEELEAYRASFGFSADEIITTTNYVEISDVLEDL
ncbi:UNVERIFIED_CONTAM: hypothetical protein Sradi_3536900 [Sesamum radiatum]|uniref:Uncharacterized protein n=1 Tax=Sesamum radiatum TaxID=300843 RepID=A0AAW2QF68_SESRA